MYTKNLRRKISGKSNFRQSGNRSDYFRTISAECVIKRNDLRRFLRSQSAKN